MRAFWTAFLTGLSMAVLAVEVHAATDSNNFKCGAYTIETTPVAQGEYVGVRVKFLNRNGRQLISEVSNGGEVISLCGQHAILLIDTNTQYAPSTSVLYSEDGAVLLRKKFGEIAKHGKSDDDKFFWVETLYVKDKKPMVQLQVYSYTGRRLVESSFSQSTSYSLNFQNRRYTIQIMQPDFPG